MNKNDLNTLKFIIQCDIDRIETTNDISEINRVEEVIKGNIEVFIESHRQRIIDEIKESK